MNDLTVEQTADDLAKQGLGPAGLGAEAKTDPTFPLRGMLWQYRRRQFFSMIGALDCCWSHSSTTQQRNVACQLLSYMHVVSSCCGTVV